MVPAVAHCGQADCIKVRACFADACWPAGLIHTCAYAVLDLQSALKSTSAYTSLRSPGKLLRMTLFLRSPAAGASFVGAPRILCFGTGYCCMGGSLAEPRNVSCCHKCTRACPTCGCAAAGNFFGIVLYDALYRLAALVGPAHHFLLKPFPALLFRWDCLVRRSISRSTHCIVQHC